MNRMRKVQDSRRLVDMLGVTNSETSPLRMRTKMLSIQCLHSDRSLLEAHKFPKKFICSYLEIDKIVLRRVCPISLNRCKVRFKEITITHSKKY